MNYVEVIGGTKKQRILSEDVAFWCIEKMMPRMKTLEIEMIHVKQYARNEFSIRTGSSGENYWDLPYEIEAYELQDTLLKEYKGEI